MKLNRLATIDPHSQQSESGRPPRMNRQMTIDKDGRRSVAAVSHYQNGKQQRHAQGRQQSSGTSSAKISRSLDNLLNTVRIFCRWCVLGLAQIPHFPFKIRFYQRLI